MMMKYKRFDGEPLEDFKQRIAADLKLVGWGREDINAVLEGLPDFTMVVTLNITDDRCKG